MLTRSIRWLALGLVMVATSARGGERGWHTFVSKRDKFSVSYPGEWRLLEPRSGAFLIVNFPKKAAREGTILPAGGASIAVEKAGPGVSMEAWVAAGLGGSTLVSKTEVEGRGRPAGCSRLLEVIDRSDEGPPGKAVTLGTAFYCQLGDSLFRTQLVTWQGDPGLKALQNLARQVAETVRHADAGSSNKP